MILYILKSVDARSGQKESIVAYGKRAPWLRLLLCPWFSVNAFPFTPKSSSHRIRLFRREISYIEAVKDSEFYAKLEEDSKKRDEQKRLQDEARARADAERAKNEAAAALAAKPPAVTPSIPGKKKVTMGTVRHLDTGLKP